MIVLDLFLFASCFLVVVFVCFVFGDLSKNISNILDIKTDIFTRAFSTGVLTNNVFFHFCVFLIYMFC